MAPGKIMRAPPCALFWIIKKKNPVKKKKPSWICFSHARILSQMITGSSWGLDSHGSDVFWLLCSKKCRNVETERILREGSLSLPQRPRWLAAQKQPEKWSTLHCTKGGEQSGKTDGQFVRLNQAAPRLTLQHCPGTAWISRPVAQGNVKYYRGYWSTALICIQPQPPPSLLSLLPGSAGFSFPDLPGELRCLPQFYFYAAENGGVTRPSWWDERNTEVEKGCLNRISALPHHHRNHFLWLNTLQRKLLFYLAYKLK